jgi:hypothetical protein
VPAKKPAASPAPAAKGQPARPSGAKGAQQTAPATPGSAKAVDYVAIAAGGICAGQPPRAIEAQLVKQGMELPKATQMLEAMSALCEQHREQNKSSKVAMWVGLLGGILLMVISLLASLHIHPPRHSWGMYRIIEGCFAVVGTLLFIRGLWRFVSGARPFRQDDLIAAWRKENK